MDASAIGDGVWWVGAVDWERRFFDAFIPLPRGTSYNAYLVRGGDKTALLDTVDPAFSDVLLARLGALGSPRIDYVVSNHAEQDHSGTLPRILELNPGALVVASPKGKGLLVDLLDIPEERILAVEDGATLPLGGKTLEFIHAPWVHWPETMFTYLREERILFPCDLFGSHLATSELYAPDETRAREAALLYFAEIMMPFRSLVARHMERLRDRPIDVIAPSHGPVYDRPAWILESYRRWAGEEIANLVVLPYVSMHGSTRRMVLHLVEALVRRGVRVEPFELTQVDVGRLAMALVDAATIVLGSPCVLAGLHPRVAEVAFLANALRPKARYASLVGSFGWGAKMVEQLASLTPSLKVELLDPVLVRGHPGPADLQAQDRLAGDIAERHARLHQVPRRSEGR